MKKLLAVLLAVSLLLSVFAVAVSAVEVVPVLFAVNACWFCIPCWSWRVHSWFCDERTCTRCNPVLSSHQPNCWWN